MQANDNDRGNSHNMCHDRPNKAAVDDRHQFEPLLSPLLVAKKYSPSVGGVQLLLTNPSRCIIQELGLRLLVLEL